MTKKGISNVLAYLATVRSFSRDARLLLATQALASISYIGIYLVLFNLYLVRLGYDTGFIGWINGVSFLCFALFSLPAGMMGARQGVRWAAVVGLLVAGIGLVLTPLAEFVPMVWQAHWLVITYILAWLGAALYTVNFIPFLVGVTDAETRNHVFAFAAAGVPAGAFVGSLLGGLLPGWFAGLLAIAPDCVTVYRHSLWLGALLFLLTAPLLFLTRPLAQEAQKNTEEEAAPAPYGFMVLMALVIVLRLASESAGKAFFTVYLDTNLHVPTASIGAIVAIGQLLAIPAALFTPILLSRWGRPRTILGSLLGITICLLPLALIPLWSVATLAYIALMVFSLIAQPALNVYTQEMTPKRWRATMAGAVTMAGGIGQAVMSMGGGYLIAGVGYGAFYWLGALLGVFSALFFAGYLYRSARRTQGSVFA